MIILDQNLQLSSRHSALSENRMQRTHETYVGGMLTSKTNEKLTESSFSQSEASLSFSKNALQYASNETQQNQRRHHLENQQFKPQASAENPKRGFQGFPLDDTAVTENSAESKSTLPPHLIKMIEAIESLMEKMTGKPYHLKVYGYEPTAKETSTEVQTGFSAQYTETNLALNFSGGFGQPLRSLNLDPAGERWTLQSSYREREQTQFQAAGRVTTADGREIAFDMNMQMSRSFSQNMAVQKEQGFILKDPLVVNFGGSPANLAIEKTAFDLDADGVQDSISFVSSGSGFLALDRNQDGQINDGSELFGTQSGNGFADLSQYDEDQNGWIDENDAIFAQLQIWHKDANGMEQLQGLLELNIGAIALQNVDTPFSHKDAHNQLQGQVVSSGLFLYEDGSGAGSVQQIDLAV